ncbi:MAG: type II toxin-antitoxin system RelE/ParE family toxin [Acidobacteria bacterium]|nr:type II toxin-antitoxin system RelE/ParE family toxin [Acidobacteriota bacterium]
MVRHGSWHRGERSYSYVCVTILTGAFRVLEYVREDGSTPFGSWFNRLDHHAAAKVATAVARVSAGNTSSIKWFSGIGETRIDWGPGYRVYLAKDGESLILLFCGGAKKRQQADIETALALHAEYKNRKKASTKKAR